MLKKYWPSCITLILFLGIFLFNYKNIYCLSILNDEFGYWGNAATIAGWDWHSLLARTPYYSMGYSFVLVPLLKLGWSPSSMYRAAVLLNMCFLYVSYLCALYISGRLFPHIQSCLRQMICLASVASCASLFYSQIAWCEAFLMMLMWILISLFVRLEMQWSYTTALSIVVIAVIAYFTHQRVILLVPLMIGVLLIGCLQNRRYAFAICILLLSVFLMFGYKFLHKWQTDFVYGASEASSLNNVAVTSSFVGSYMDRLFGNIGDITISFLCKLGVLMLTTAFSLYAACVHCVDHIQKKDYSFWKTKAAVIVPAIMMLFLSSVQMFSADRKDLVVYSRYMDFAFPAVTLFGLCQLMSNEKWNRRLYPLFTLTTIPLLILSMFRIQASEGIFNTACSPIWGSLIERYGVSNAFIAGGVLVEICILLCIVSVYMLYKNSARWKYIFLIIVLVLNISGFWLANGRINSYRDRMHAIIQEANETMSAFPQSDVYCVLPKYEKEMAADYRMKELQSIAYDRPIHVYTPEMVLEEGSLLLSEMPLQDDMLRTHCEPLSTENQIKIFKYHKTKLVDHTRVSS